MVTVVVETFVNDRRQYKQMDLRDIVNVAVPGFISAGIDTGILDRDGVAIATNHYVKFKGNLCRLTIAEGQVMIKHKKFGLCPLAQWYKDCQVVR